jgi:hypothetical protein
MYCRWNGHKFHKRLWNKFFFKALDVELLVKLGSHPYFAPFIQKNYESFMEEMILLENVDHGGRA